MRGSIRSSPAKIHTNIYNLDKRQCMEVFQGRPKITVQIESTIIELKVYKADEGMCPTRETPHT